METEMSYGSDYHYLPVTSLESGVGLEVIPDIFCQTDHVGAIVVLIKHWNIPASYPGAHFII